MITTNNHFKLDASAPVNFSELWASITEELDTWDKTWPEKIEALGQIDKVRARRRGRTFSDEEIFEGIVKAVLSGAIDWSRIQKLSPDKLNQLFGEFNVTWYSRLAETHIANDFVPWFKAHRADSQYLKRNLNFLVSTAAKLVERKEQHGNLESYLSTLLKQLSGDVIGLAKTLGTSSAHKLDGFGIAIAAEALKNIGYDIGKPDIHINRAFGSFGLQVFGKWPDRAVGTKAPKATDTEKLAVMRRLSQFADHLEVEATLVDNAIWLLCAKSGAYLSNKRLSSIRTRHAYSNMDSGANNERQDIVINQVHENPYHNERDVHPSKKRTREMIAVTPMDTNLLVPEQVRLICQELAASGGEVIKRQDILRLAEVRGINLASVLPADYCDNTVTGKWNRFSFLHSVGRGKYVLR